MILSIVACIVVGSLIWLDRVFMFQFMISRPIVLSPILGIIMGNVYIGLLVGASLELLWLNAPPVGAYLPNDESFSALIATPVAVYAGSSINEISAVGLALVLSIPFSIAGRWLDTHIRTVNQGLLPNNTDNMEIKINRAMRKALIRSYIYALLALGICTAFLCLVVFFIKDTLPGFFVAGLSYMPLASIIIGLTGLISRDVPKLTKTGLFVLGMTIVLIVTWIL